MKEFFVSRIKGVHVSRRSRPRVYYEYKDGQVTKKGYTLWCNEVAVHPAVLKWLENDSKYNNLVEKCMRSERLPVERELEEKDGVLYVGGLVLEEWTRIKKDRYVYIVRDPKRLRTRFLRCKPEIWPTEEQTPVIWPLQEAKRIAKLEAEAAAAAAVVVKQE